MDERPDNISRIFITLETESQWATCQRGRVATALATPPRQIVVLARNGVPAWLTHCPQFAPADMRCQYCIHSETNAILRASKIGIRTEGLDLFTLKRPCLGCSNNIVEAGIGGVYYREEYDTDGERDYVMNMFFKRGIYVRRWEPTLQEQTFSAMITQWRATWQTQPE